jgi:hypothetical protein
MVALPLPDKTTDMTTSHLTDETTSHSTRLPKDNNQVAGYNPAKDAGQVIGYSHSTNPASEKLLDGHPKDAGQVIDETTSHLTKAASCQVIGYGYSHSTRRANSFA